VDIGVFTCSVLSDNLKVINPVIAGVVKGKRSILCYLYLPSRDGTLEACRGPSALAPHTLCKAQSHWLLSSDNPTVF